MKDNYTAIGVIIDRSGSMAHLEEDTIGGFNTFLKTQKELPGEADMTLVLFDDKYEVIHDCKPLAEVPDLDSKTYFARGRTALLDAIGRTIKTMGARFAAMDEADRPCKVILTIITDGYENASREYTRDQVLALLKEHQEKYSWEVLYFGANQDAIAVGRDIGVSASNSVNWRSDSHGTQDAYTMKSLRVATSRSANKMSPEDRAKYEAAIDKLTNDANRTKN